MRDMKQYILDNVIIDKDGCWIWQKSHNNRGYGNAQNEEGKIEGAHRVSYKAFKGPIEKGKEVDHRCDKRMCVRPDCLTSLGKDLNAKLFWRRNLGQMHRRELRVALLLHRVVGEGRDFLDERYGKALVR